ncbi:MAG: 3-dehydroquinate synthase [Clostridia bacterium]|nr:3-dehydroquinate synthase [Clostridia bacterium]
MDELQQAREEIDRVDREMAKLFERRMRVVKQIADYKQANRLPVLDPAREEAVVAKNSGYVEEDIRPCYVEFLRDVMKGSRHYQARLLSDSSDPSPLQTTPTAPQTAAEGDGVAVLSVSYGNTPADRYDVIVSRGALGRIGSLLKLQRRVLVVTDDGVPPIYAETVAAACKSPVVVTVPQGEDSKSMATLSHLLSTMLEAGFTRTDAVVAVGGGVVGDLSGFAAATFMRGIDFYNVPTTLLSQVDSSIGGKTAVNMDGIKNCVGAFHQPRRVVIDPDTLSTLPPRQIANGLAEAIKMAATCDAAFFARMEQTSPLDMLDDVILSALAIKKDVVEKDAKEKSLRRVLNFGHTLGHGIESQFSMRDLYHGECVALGMLPLCAPEVRERLVKVLSRVGLPTEVEADLDVVLDAVAHDKKMEGDNIHYVYVPEIGQFELRSAPLAEFRSMAKEAFTK